MGPMKINDVFCSLVNKKLIGYKKYDDELGAFILDLHLFQLWEAQFIIRYLIGFEWKQLLEMMIDDKLWIITGKGNHSNTKGKLKDFVIHELNCWDPPIECNMNSSNHGRIYIRKRNLLSYLNDSNHAKSKLIQPSSDWHLKSPKKT